MFGNIETALLFLKSLDMIVIPVEYTYFHHCTNYMKNPPKYSNCWESVPYDTFTVKREMSFSERDSRILEALRFGGLQKASTTYKKVEGAKTFNIRVIIPKNYPSDETSSKLGIDDDYKAKLNRIYFPPMDGRHPKLPHGTKVHIFASSRIDEVSGKKVDILYGVREEDIIMYANSVASELMKGTSIKEPIMPSCYMQREGFYSYDTDYEFNHRTYALPRDKDLTRYIPFAEQEGIFLSEFEQEFRDGIDINTKRRI